MIPAARFETVWNIRKIGGKARGCQKLFDDGVAVPDSLAFASDFLESGDVPSAAKILESFFQAPRSVIVRSSGEREDGFGVSWAGKYRSSTVFSRPSEESAPFFTTAAARIFEIFRAMPEDDRSSGGVLVQEFFEFSHAWVAFSADPSHGEHGCVAEFVPGSPESLVSGTRTPQRAVFSRIGKLPSLPKDPIPGFDWESFRNRLIEWEKRLGFPVDVEWGWNGKVPTFLQIRPVTALSSESARLIASLDDFLAQTPESEYRRLPAAEAFDTPSDEEFALLETVFSKCVPAVLAKYGIRFRYGSYFRRIFGRLYLETAKERQSFWLSPDPEWTLFDRFSNRVRLTLVPVKIEWSGNRKLFPRLERELLASWSRALELLSPSKSRGSSDGVNVVSEFLNHYAPIFETNFLASSHAAYRKKLPRSRRTPGERKDFFGTLSSWQGLFQGLSAAGCVGNSLSLSDLSPFSSPLADKSFRDIPPHETILLPAERQLEFFREAARAVSVLWSNVLRSRGQFSRPASRSKEGLAFEDVHFPERIRSSFFDFPDPGNGWEPLSPGIAEGVLVSIELSKLPEGFDIPTVVLVDSIPPELAYALPKNTAGIISRTGALLSHFAIVARERGLPAFRCANPTPLRSRIGTPVRIDDSGWR